VASLVLAGEAQAGTVRPAECGEVITESIQLANDVGPCPGDGLVVGADNIVIDLNGHRVSGTPGPQQAEQDTVGIRLEDRSYVKVTSNPPKDAVVTDFDAGILIDGGMKNHVEKITWDNNVSLGCGFAGDGIAVSGSDENHIVNNVVTRNGPFDGIGLFDGASENNVVQNVVHDNNVVNPFCNPGHNPGDPQTQEDDGIRLEPGVLRNLVSQNDVRRNGLDGIAVFPNSRDNTVQQNEVVGNGVFIEPVGQRRGNGVMIFQRANLNTVHQNFIEGSGYDGIGVVCRSRTFCAFENVFLSNDIPGNTRDGIRVGNPNGPQPAVAVQALNRFQGNDLGPNNNEHDCHDDTTGTGDGGTGNFWRHNDPSSPMPDNRGGQICPGDPNPGRAPEPTVTEPGAASTKAGQDDGREDGVGQEE
jgi:nitrous oxidase accessory protein NosD